MDKFSELSKPVAYDYQIAGACIADGNDKKWVDWDNKITHECPPDWMVEDGKVTGIKLLYSQEYVSALLAELEFEKQNNAGVAGMVEDYETKLEAKDKRIAELEGQLQSGFTPEALAQEERAENAEQRVAELEAKTAMTMGVGSGNGNLFVHGDYDSIKAAQAIVLENESLRAKLATPVRLTEERTLWAGEDDYDTGHVKGWNANRIEQAALLKKQGFTVAEDA